MAVGLMPTDDANLRMDSAKTPCSPTTREASRKSSSLVFFMALAGDIASKLTPLTQIARKKLTPLTQTDTLAHRQRGARALLGAQLSTESP